MNNLRRITGGANLARTAAFARARAGNTTPRTQPAGRTRARAGRSGH